MKFGESMKKARQDYGRNGLGLRSVAKYCARHGAPINHGTLLRIERGDRPAPTLPIARAWCKALRMGPKRTTDHLVLAVKERAGAALDVEIEENAAQLLIGESSFPDQER